MKLKILINTLFLLNITAGSLGAFTITNVSDQTVTAIAKYLLRGFSLQTRCPHSKKRREGLYRSESLRVHKVLVKGTNNPEVTFLSPSSLIVEDVVIFNAGPCAALMALPANKYGALVNPTANKQFILKCKNGIFYRFKDGNFRQISAGEAATYKSTSSAAYAQMLDRVVSAETFNV